MKKELYQLIRCVQKKTFGNEDFAINFAKMMTKKYPDKPSRSYFCPTCNKFHITTKPLWNKNEVQADTDYVNSQQSANK